MYGDGGKGKELKLVYPFDHRHDVVGPELAARLGGKGAGLAVMTALGIPVPPGFTIPTECCRTYLTEGWSSALADAVREGLAGIEVASGRRLGDPSNPLLVSVRSGAAVSMPGMMDTVLNVGMSPEVARGLARLSGDAVFAWDTYVRAVKSYAAVVAGAPDDELKGLASASSPARCDEATALAFAEAVRRSGYELPTDPQDQVAAAVEAVFRSWTSSRANAYRQREGIDAAMGTAATVQAMVFGNLGSRSGTGVAFTRCPSTGEAGLIGDFLIGAQGEDVVAGTHTSRPLHEMSSIWPEVWAELERVALSLEHHSADMLDLEFTVENGRLWLLQTRAGKRSPVAALRIAVAMANEPSFPVDRAEAVRRCRRYLDDPPTIVDDTETADPDASAVLATGLAASPGRAIGVLSVDPDDAVEREQRGERVILVRRETSPADVHGIAAAVGLVTTLGGLVSHAAVVARSWGLAAVVGAQGIELVDGALMSGDRRIPPGEVLTVDGDTGRLLFGSHPAGSRLLPEVETIRAWARVLENDAATVDTVAGAEEVTSDDCLRVVVLKGMGSAQAITEALVITGDHAEQLLGELEANGYLRPFTEGRLRPTPEAMARVDELYRAERIDRVDGFAAVLDRFHGPNRGLKEVITAWQVRSVDGAVIPNDHTDEVHDRFLLGRLMNEIHVPAGAVLDESETLLARLARYRHRLERALVRLDAGDHRFFAHPLLDSYHTVWFELHEELIRLAGRDRLSETQAGRA